MARVRALLVAALLLPLGGWEPLWRLDPDVAAGNRAYQEKRYDDAIAAYERAREAGVDTAGLEYDLGTAKIAKADAAGAAGPKPAQDALYGDAMDHLAKAAKGGSPQLRAKAHYNRGNVLMKQQKLDTAIEEYKNALRADGTMESARVNLELALRQRERERQQQQQQQQGQGQQQQQQQGQGQQQQQGGGDGQQQQQQQGQGQGQQQQQQQGQGQQGQNQGQQGQQGQPQGQGGGDQQGQQDNQGAGTASQTPQPNWPRDDTEAQTPDTPNETKFNDLEAMSRQQRREQMRNRRSRGTTRFDYDKDW